MKARDGEQGAIGRIIEGGDDRRLSVNGRMILIVALPCVFGSVVYRPFRDPTTNQGDLDFVERVLFLGHLHFSFGIGSDFLDEVAFLRFSGNNRDGIFATLEKAIKIGHDVVATIL